MKSRLLLPVLLIVIAVVLTAAVFMKPNPQKVFLEKRAILVVRSIGHQLLLHSGDSTSRVLPVRESGQGIFELEFQNRFSFKPDSLVNIVQRELASGNLPVNYMVNVFDCSSREMVYGFEIRPGKTDIVPCLGRIQPSGCYSIRIEFFDAPDSGSASPVYYLSFIALGSILLFAFVGGTYRTLKKKSAQSKGQFISIGKYEFDEVRKTLKGDSGTIELSHKETKLLGILAANVNQLIDREHLLREVWENEGVITGRSLDMFVSKLRKRLIGDSSIRIANIHGRGYKLEIN